MALLLAVGVVSLVAQPPLWTRAAALVGVVLFFAGMRHAIGNWVQAHFFMATDFSQASLRAIRKVRAKDIEVAPAYFVETTVCVREKREVAPNKRVRLTSGAMREWTPLAADPLCSTHPEVVDR